MSEDSVSDRLRTLWQLAARDLGFVIVAPFQLTLPGDVVLDIPLLVPRFGGPNGMLVLADFAVVVKHVEAVSQAGYGFSVLSPPPPEEPYDPEMFLDVLDDWGWTGPPLERPYWLDEG